MTNDKPLNSYQMSILRGEKLVLAYSMEHAIYERPADIIADIYAYCDAHNINFLDEVEMASIYIDDERAEQAS